MESALLQGKKKKRQAGREKAQDGVGACACMPWHTLPLPPTRCRSLVRFHHLHPRTHPACVCACAPTLHTFTPAVTPTQGVFVFSVYMQVCRFSSVGSLKLCGEVWFMPSYRHCEEYEGVRSAPFCMCACTAALTWFCACRSCEPLPTNVCFLSCCNKG